MIEDLKNIKSGKKQLQECGLLLADVLIILGAILIYKQRPAAYNVLSVGIVFAICGTWFWKILKPFQKVWMGAALIMGFFVSRIILFIVFYFVVTPISLLIRVMGKDILDQKIDKDKDSYWQDADSVANEKESYENQY